MADEEAEKDNGSENVTNKTIWELQKRLQELHEVAVTDDSDSRVHSSSEYCQEFCRTLVDYAGRWKIEDEPLPLVEVYIVALLSYAKAAPYLSRQCENVSVVIDRLSLSFMELLLSLKDIPDDLWGRFKSSLQFVHSTLQENGLNQLSPIATLVQYDGVWNNSILQSLLSNENTQMQLVEEFLEQEGLTLSRMRVKQLMKEKQLEKAALLARACSECAAFEGKGPFKQMYLVCLCTTLSQDKLIEEISKEDCHDALEMICNLDSEGDEMAAFSLCSAFLSRQLLQGDMYCAWELTLIWSKLLKRLEPTEQSFLDRCRQMSLLSKSVYHILFFIKVVQSELDGIGLPACVEMCIRALLMESDDSQTKATMCKTISCLLPSDLEVKRACQLTEFLLEPTVDSYYAVETIYNEPDQKLEEENRPIPNSLRCELLLAFKNLWPFDPEFWDWKTLKRYCLGLMGEEASIVSSIDHLNDNESPEEEEEEEEEEDLFSTEGLNTTEHLTSGTYDLKDVSDKREKNREMKKLREKGFISARFRNWQAYMQYCVLCDKEFLGHRIVRHAQTHVINGVYTCPICALSFTSKDTLLPHVTLHVKQSSKERLSVMKTKKNLANLVNVPDAQSRTENEVRKTNNNLLGSNGGLCREVKVRLERCSTKLIEENICPVGNCRRSFKFFRNLLAHVKTHGDDREAKSFLEMQRKKVVCQYCCRYFLSVNHLNDHLQVHCGARPYICIQLNCNASFLSNTELLAHRKIHSEFKAKCMFPDCGKIFSEAFKLYDHESHHYKTFTCNVADCGQVFNSQQQMDVHQSQHKETAEIQTPEHSSSKVPSESSERVLEQLDGYNEQERGIKVEYASSEVTSQNDASTLVKHAQQQLDVRQDQQNDGKMTEKTPQDCINPTLIEQILLSQMQENYDDNWKTEHFQNPDNETLPNAFESLLKQSQEPVDGKMHYGAGDSNNSTFADRHAQNLSTSVIQEPNSHVYCGESSFVDFSTHQQSHSIAAFEQNVSQGQPQLFQSNASAGLINYCPDSNFLLQGAIGPPCRNNASTASLHQKCLESTMPGPLASTVTPQLHPVSRPETSMTSPTVAVPLSGQRERYHCASPVCTKHYSTYKSVTKHMRTTHPDFYEQWKLNPSKIRISCTSAPCPSDRRLNSATSLQYPQDNSVPLHEAQRQNVIQSPYNNMSKNSNHASGYLQSSSVQNQSTSLLMEDVINPIVLAQLGSGSNISTHSQVPCSRNLHAVHQNKQTDNSGYYQVSSSQQTNDGSVSAVLPVNYSSVMTASLLSRPPESLGPPQMENSLAFPLCVDGEKETSQKLQKTFSTLTSQMESKLVAGSVVPEKSSPHFSDHAGQVINSNRALNGLVVNDAPFGPRPQAKRSSKSKWPAIIKDGKFVCRRCFREFNSSKSLGGHLSKRLTCKPNNEHNFITAQTASGFGPHSKQTILSPGLLGQESLLKTVKTEPSYLQNKSNGTIFKQTASELFLQTPNPRSLFPNTCVPFAANERLPSSSVIQHTESVQLDRNGGVQDNSYNAAHYSESNIDTYTGCDFPEPSLSLIPMEKSSSAVLGNIFTSHFNSGTVHSRGCSAMPTRTPDLNPENQPLLPVGRLSPVSVNEKQAKIQRITSDQDVKKRLREQILSGDFQRRNNSCDQSNADPIINFSEPVSFGQMCTTPVASKYGQMTSDAKKELARHGQDMQGTPNEIQQQNAVSFEGFREPSAPEKDEHGPSTSALIDLDCEPTPLSPIQQLWMAEIQGAFQKLNLLQEISEDVAPKNTTITSQSVLDKVSSPTVMPFRCENVTCPFSSFSSESLWRHLSKSHSYTHEMVNVVKKRYGLYAPYKCQHCVKNFTRNSNLRAHYQSAHKLTSQEIADLDMKRRQTKATPPAHNPKWPINTDQAPVDCNPALAATGLQQDAVLHNSCSQSLLPNANTAATTEANQGDNCCTVSNPLQTSPMNKQHPIMLAQTPTSRQPPGSDDVNAVNIGTSLEAKPSTDAPKKTKERKTNAAPLSPYRPYRCVHQGCVAAFAVQHNLILHYRAVHQAALSSLEVNKEKNQCEELDDATKHEEEPEADTAEMTEFRCQVKDCSGVFQEVQQLLKHYLHLHEFTLDKGGRLLSSTKLGKFTCGHQGCTASFIGSWTYITHIKEQHIDLNLVRSEQLSCLFKCEIEGCDRSYATKSNLLRHAMKIHKELYEPEVKSKQSPKGLHYQITKISNGKENIESNKKILESEKLAKRASHSKRNHWTQYGKPSLKTKGEAIAMCTKTFHLQYPCMIKGCESVMKSERSIMKHYMGHGLSEKYLELQRSHFIFCKKFPRQKAQSIRYEDSKSENASDISNNEESGDSGMEAGEYRRSKTVLRKRASRDIPAALFDSKLCVDESSDGSVVIKRKRGRPRKHKKIPHSPKIDLAYNGSDFCHSTLFAEEKAEQSAPMASFKPMGFEMSFLQFLEQSSQSEKASTKKADLSAATSTQSSLKAKDVTVRFRNHQNLKSLSQVKINIDAAFSSVSDLMLKQLQGMHPTVVLGRNSRNPFVLI